MTGEASNQEVDDSAGDEAQNDLVNVERRDFYAVEEDEHGKAGQHGCQAGLCVSFSPVESADHRPEERGFESAEGEQVDPDDDIRRIDGNQAGDDAEQQGDREAVPWNSFLCFFCAFRTFSNDVVQVEILDDGRGCEDQQGVDGGHDGGERRGQEETGGPGRHAVQNDVWNDGVGGFDGVIWNQRRGQCSGKVHADHEDADDDSSIDHGAVHGARVLEAHSADGGLRKAQRCDADQDPEGDQVSRTQSDDSLAV